MDIQTAEEADLSNATIPAPIHLCPPDSDFALCGVPSSRSADRSAAKRYGICPDCVDMVLLEKS